MEKCTKLKLKRKPKESRPNQAKFGSHSERDPLASSNAPSLVEEFVELTSESDGEEPTEKQKKMLESEGDLYKKRNFLDVGDPQLRKLRELILKISGNQGPAEKVSQFPPHPDMDIEQTMDEATIESDSTKDVMQRRLSYEVPDLLQSTQLSPFPSMCSWCMKRRSSNHNCPKKSRNLQIANQNCVPEQSNLFECPGMEETCKNVKDHSGAHPLTNVLHNNVSVNASVTENPKSEIIPSKHLESDVVSNQRHSLQGNRSNSDFNNSHLMRDRNSNYYSLQSRNSINRHAAVNNNRQIQKQLTNQRKESSIVSGDMCHEKGKTEKVMLNVTSDTGVKTDDQSTFDLAFDSDSELEVIAMSDEENEVSSQNQALKFCTTALDQNQPNNASKSGRTYQNEPNISKSKSRNSNIKQEIPGSFGDSKDQKSGKDNKRTLTAVDVRRPNKVPVASVNPCLSYKKPEKSKEDVKSVSVQNCPLCQVEFAPSTTQMEIDGHIAACLLAADDDVMW